MTKILLMIASCLLITLSSCNKDKSKVIDLKLLQSDWLNAKYNYILFFNNKTVLTPPNDNRTFLFNYHLNSDTLFIESTDYKNKHSWEKYQILTLNEDVLIMKDITKTNVRLTQDTITLINSSTTNKNEFTFKRINYTFQSLYKKELEIIGDSLSFSGSGNTKHIGNYYAKLTPDIINQINRKIKLLDFNYSKELDQGGPHTPLISFKIVLEGYENPIELNGGVPSPDDNLKLAGFFVYLNNLDEIVDLHEIKK